MCYNRNMDSETKQEMKYDPGPLSHTHQPAEITNAALAKQLNEIERKLDVVTDFISKWAPMLEKAARYSRLGRKQG